MRQFEERMIWLNPVPTAYWDSGHYLSTIQIVRNEVSMFPLSVQGLEQGLSKAALLLGVKIIASAAGPAWMPARHRRFH